MADTHLHTHTHTHTHKEAQHVFERPRPRRSRRYTLSHETPRAHTDAISGRRPFLSITCRPNKEKLYRHCPADSEISGRLTKSSRERKHIAHVLEEPPASTFLTVVFTRSPAKTRLSRFFFFFFFLCFWKYELLSVRRECG